MFFFSSRRRHTRLQGDWSSDVCSSDLAYFNFSAGSNDVTNDLSDPLGSVNFYAHPSEIADAQLQIGGAKDQRVLDKIAAATDTQLVGGISEIPGTDKFTVYFTGGVADQNHSIPIIRDEELVLLRAE